MQAVVSPPRPDQAKRARPVKILLVDDRPENLISLESILEDPGREILKAGSGNEALHIALKEDIAVMLLDVQMPEMDGFEVARLLKDNSKTREISIIFVTALSKEERYTMQAYEEGAVDYLHKPLDVNVVKAKVAVFEKLYRQKIELREYTERLESVNKQLDEFVYIVSHDLKAPLRGLASLASFLEDELGPQLKAEALDLLHMMKSRTACMQQLIDGILHYSRMANNRVDREDVDLNELIHIIIDLIAPNANVQIESPDNLPVILAERVKLHEVLQNLIINGIKYNDKSEIRIRIGFEDKGSHYHFHVTDNGIGIKPEHQEKIFGIFQTLQPKDKCESTGIGLTIVKKIIEQQEGTISITSEFGSGTTFSFTWKK